MTTQENDTLQIREVLDMLGLVYPEDATDAQLIQFVLKVLMQYHSQLSTLKVTIKNMTESFNRYVWEIRNEYSNAKPIIEYNCYFG